MTHRTLGRVCGALLFCLALAALGRPAALVAQGDTPTPEATAPAVEAPATGLPTGPTTAPPPARVDPDGRFGVIESYDDTAAATRLGASWTRLRFQWADVQPDGPDDWQPPLDDHALDAELDDGRLVVGLLIGIPDWARDRRLLPEGLDLPPNDPGNTWASFVREAVSRYEGRIDHWIIWNEPDIDDPDAPGHTWDGSVEEFAQLLRVAYLVAKEANPDAVIHLPAFTHFWDPGYFGRFLDILLADSAAAAHNHYFDVATAHLYFQPEAIYDVISGFRADMTSRGLRQPIWLVETNAPPADDTYWLVPNWTLYVTVYEQAAFVPQALASALAARAERVAVFKLMDVDGDRAANPEPFGLLRQDSSRRPAFDTYRIAIRQLDGATTAVRERWDAVGQIRVDQGDRTTTVLFARLPEAQEATVRATSETAELVDMWGKRRTLTAEKGVFTVPLQPALCVQTIGDYCMIGGTVVYLVQPKGESGAGAVPPGALLPDAVTDVTPRPAGTPRPPATPVPAATSTSAAPTLAATPASVAPATAPPAAIERPTTAVAASAPMATSMALTQPSTVEQAPSGASPVSGLLLIGVGLLGALALGGWVLYGRRAK